MKMMDISVESKPATIADFLELTASEAGTKAWVLFESAKKAGLTRLADFRCDGIADSLSRVIVFSDNAEMRFEKQAGEVQGEMRLVRMGAAQGIPCRVREGNYILHRDSGFHGRLLYREFFRPEESGMLTFFCGCLAGVKE